MATVVTTGDDVKVVITEPLGAGRAVVNAPIAPSLIVVQEQQAPTPTAVVVVPGPQGPAGAQGTGLQLKGYVATVAELPATGTQGDGWVVGTDLYVWQATAWVNVGPFRGPQGPIGPAGEAGAVGPQGELGPRGPVGLQGPHGLQGSEGVAGAIGPIGPQGLPGPIGPKGSRGMLGPVGPQGISGPAGSIGPKGNVGPRGPIGPQGITGMPGPKGDRGETGSGLNILDELLSVSQLPPSGVPGDAYIINGALWVWSSSAGAWNDMGIVKGPPGPMGLQGAVGPRGPRGPKGDIGPLGPQGVGADGKSAYSVALDNGFIGSTRDWLRSLRGAVGPRGPRGPRGTAGTPGERGPVGPEGAGVFLRGKLQDISELPATADVRDAYVINTHVWVWNGSVWIDLGVLAGPEGPQGPTGPAGPVGPTGPTGPAGPPGPEGPAGPEGIQGPRGLQGLKGDTGATGATGAQGPQGIQGPAGVDGKNGLKIIISPTQPENQLEPAMWVKTGVTDGTATIFIWNAATLVWDAVARL